MAFDFAPLYYTTDGTYGEDIVLSLDGDDVETTGIFDSVWLDQDELGGIARVSGLFTTCEVTLSKSGPVTTSHTVTRASSGQEYTITDIRQDGLGVAVLVLQEA